MNHYIYSAEMIKSMQKHLEKNARKFITYPKFVFLCGNGFSDPKDYEKTNRGIVDKYLKRSSKDVFIVLSEYLWEDNFNSNIDLLTFEEFLAEVSDAIILFVEGPGSFCELGAFAYADQLFSDKLIIVIDQKYKNDNSFIIKGPTAKAAKDGSCIVYAPISHTGLLASADMRKVLQDLLYKFASKNAAINKRRGNETANQITLNSFIIELLELIKLTQPIRRRDLIDLYKKVKGFSAFTFIKKDGTTFKKEIRFDYIIKLLETVKLIQVSEDIIFFPVPERVQPLMFSYSGRDENRERNRLLCRKYRYKELTNEHR